MQEVKRLLADGPKMLSELNPKAVDRFRDRVCMTCDQPIMTHFVIENNDPELMGLWWCDGEGKQASEGMRV